MSFFSTHSYLFPILFANEILMGYSKLVQSRFQIYLDSPSLPQLPAAQIMKYGFWEDMGRFPSLPLLLLKFLIFIDFSSLFSIRT